MKGIILEADKQKIIVLDESGQFTELVAYGKKYTVGEEITIPARKNHFSGRFVALAASLMILVTSGAGFGAYYYPQGYINIDVNPSIEISYNIFERVIRARGLNQEGQDIVKQLGELKNQKIDYAVKQFIDEIEEQGYIDNTDDHLALITINGNDPDNSIMESIVDDFDQAEMTYDLTVADGSKKIHKRHSNLPEAVEVTPGDFNLMEKIQVRERQVEDDEDSVNGEETQKQQGKTTQQMIEEVKEKGKQDEIHEIKGKQKSNEDSELPTDDEMTIEEEKIDLEEEINKPGNSNGKKEGGKK